MLIFNRVRSIHVRSPVSRCVFMRPSRTPPPFIDNKSGTIAVRKLSLGSGHQQQPQDRDNNKKNMGILSGALVGASVLLGKTKYVLAALKVTKMGPLVSMLITSATYSLFFGWPYAIGMVGLIFVHECGHAVAMKYYNVPFSPMVFVPFMGAAIAMKEYPADAKKEAVIAIAGPIAGSVAALSLGTAGYALDSQLMMALADWGYMINLFNLMPIGSMDGGRITSAISPYFGLIGLAGGAGLIYTGSVANPIFYLIMLGGAYSTSQRIMGWDTRDLPPGYYNLSRGTQASVFGGYLAVIVALIAAMGVNNRKRKTPRQLERETVGGVEDDFRGSWQGLSPDFETNDTGALYDDYFDDKNDNNRRF